MQSVKLALVSKVAFFFLLSVSFALADETLIEKRFQSSLLLVNAGKAADAIPELQRLYRDTKAPRIRLELARALMLAGQLQEARNLFVEAYEDNPPVTVKSTIINFINTIDRLEGKLTLGLTFSKITNPLAQPTSFGFNFGGIYFKFKNEPQLQNSYGVTYFGRYEKQFNDGWNLKTFLSYRDMQGTLADLFSGDFSGGKFLQQTPIELRTGIQFQNLQNNSYRLPYVEAAYTYPLSAQLNFVPRVQVGYFHSLEGEGYSGGNYRFLAPVVYSINPAESLAVGPRMEIRNANYAEQSYKSVGISIDASLHYEWMSVELTVFPKISDFSATDPFWGIKRFDRSLYAGVELSSDYIRYRGFLPTLNGNCDFNRSNIEFYSSDNCSINLGLKKIF